MSEPKKPDDYVELSDTPAITTIPVPGGTHRILTRDDWEYYKAEADGFYRLVDDEWVEQYNRSRDFDDETTYEEAMAPILAAIAKRGPRQGYVYLLASEDGYYKIGRAVDAASRFKCLSIQLPTKVRLEHQFKSNDYAAAEVALHSKFQDKRANGEWFRLFAEDVEYIKSLADEW